MNKFYQRASYVLLVTNILTFAVFGYFFYRSYTQRSDAENNLAELQVAYNQDLSAQRAQKNEIADLWDDQAALNDDLIDAQRDLVNSSKNYQLLISKSVRFVNGEPQFFQNVKEEDFVNAENDLVQKISELQGISEENATEKNRNAERIRQIYLDAGEDRNNTANEREGFR